MTPLASIVITSRNRREELERSVASAVAQKVAGSVEIIVIDDGSADGTSEMITRQFPQAQLHRFEASRGLIVQRNFGAKMATAPIVVSLDDDAIFSSADIVAHVLEQFDQPEIGAVAIPFINIRQDDRKVFQRAPDSRETWITSAYIGTAHALRRDLFLELDGYREVLFHQGEEGDYCVRLLQSGHVVRLGQCDPIHHFESPRRDFRRVDLYGRRNNILFGWHNAPTAVLPTYLAATTWNGLRHGVRVGRPWTMVQGLLNGYRSVGAEWKKRAPISAADFGLYRELVRRQAVPLTELRGRLSPLGKLVRAGSA